MRFLFLTTCLVCVASAAANAQKSDPWSHLERVTEVTTLERAGMQPWHIRLSFQLYELDGKPASKGTVDEWWFGEGKRRIAIAEDAPPAEVDDPLADSPVRHKVLVQQLLREAVHPVPSIDKRGVRLREAKRTLGNSSMSCIAVASGQDPPLDLAAFSGRQYCVDANDSLRVMQDGGYRLVVRNRVGKFRESEVGTDITLSYANKTAITGHVESLENVTSADDASKVDPDATATGASPVRTSYVPPQFPASLAGHVKSVNVTFTGGVSPDGRLEHLHIIASSSPAVSSALAEAVKKWKYKPSPEGTPADGKLLETIEIRYG